MSLIIPILILLLLVGLTAIIVIPRIDSIKKWIKKNWKKIIGFILAGSLSAGGLILYDGEDGPPINPPAGPEFNFGFESTGTTSLGAEDFQIGSRATPTSGDGVGVSITARILDNEWTGSAKCALYEYVDNTSSYAGDLLAETEEVDFSTIGTGNHWIEFNFTGDGPTITNNTDYYLVCWAEETSGYSALYREQYTGWSFYKYDYYGDWDDPLTGESSSGYRYCMYCTYEVSDAGWYSSDFDYRRDITIDSSQIDSELTNFPLLVYMDNDSGLQSHAQSDGGDIIFVDTYNVTKFNHEIEYYDSTNGTLWAWVNVTSISDDTDTHFNMYYGNDSIGNQWDIENTWNSNFRMVQHLEEEYSADADHYTDSTSNNNDASATTNYAGDPYRSEGKVGYACNFSNVDDALVLDAINEDQPITIYCWVRSDAYWEIGDPDINDGFLTNRGIISRYYANDGIRCGTANNGSLLTRLKLDDVVYDNFCHTTGATAHFWYFCAMVANRGEIITIGNDTTYLVDDTSAASNDNLNFSAYPWGIGCSTTWTKDTTSDYDFNGTVDEVVIMNGTLDPAWINATFSNQNQEEGFLTIGMEEPMINSAPNAISGESPTNSSTDIAVNSLVAGIVSDPDGDYLTVTWYSNSEGSWALFGTNTSVVNNTNISQLNSNFSDFSETYYWSMNVTDGEYWNNETFHFTTETPSQTIISQSGESPVNETTDVGLIPYLYVIVSNNNDVSMDVEWWSNSSGSWAQFDSASSVSNNTNITTFNSNFSSKDTTYYWSVNATDGIGNWTNTTYHFTSQTDDWQLKWRNINYDPNIGTPSSYTNPVADDINGDGIYEIFHGHRTYDGSWKSGIVCFNGSTGELNWQKNITTLTGYHIPMAIGDINNDGVKELVHASGTTTTARHGMNGTILWEVAQDSGWGTPAIADTDDNGWPYVYVSSNTGFEGSAATRKLNGTTGALVAISTNTSYTCYGGVSIADLDRDGEFEIVMSDSGDSICYNEDLENLWTTASFSSESHCAVLINCTGDADLEVIMLNQNGADVGPDGMYIYYANGTLWKGDSSIWAADTCHCQPAAYDIDKDGSIEVVIGKLDPPSYPDTVYVFDVDDWDNDTILEKGSEPPDFVNVIGDSDLEILSGGSWVDAYMDIYDSSYDNVDEIGSNPEINWCYGPYFIVQDVDDDGLNELCIFGGGKSATNYHNFSCYDLLTEVNSPQVRTDTTYYSERRQAAGIYIPKIGGKCVLSSESPSDGASDVSTATSTLSVSVDEPDDDPIYWSIETSPDIGSDSGEGDAEGTISCSVSDLAIDTEYTWYVNVSDNVNWKNFVYTFNTSVPEITLSNEAPTNDSSDIGPIPRLYVNIEHSTGDAMDITWWSNSTGSWVQFDSESSVANNTNISGFNSNFSDKDTKYWWSANVTDGAGTWKNETYHFTMTDKWGKLKWRTSGIMTGVRNYAPTAEPIAVDIDDDGIYEIFHAGTDDPDFDNATIFCLNGSTGEIIWQKFMSASYLVDWHIPLACDDLDNDGDYELVHAAGYRSVARNAEDGSIFWDVATDSGWGYVAIADTDDNNYPYVWVSDNTAFGGSAATSKLNGTTGALVATSTNTSYTCYGGVSIADLDRDGEFEIVMSDSGDSICYNEDLENLWTTASFGSESHCAALINLTGDEDLEVLIASNSNTNGGIYSFWANGSQIAGKCDSTLGLSVHHTLAVYDVDEDGHVEIADGYYGATEDGEIWDWTDWQSEGTLERMSEPPDFVNIINDSSLDILSGSVWEDGAYDIYDANYTNVGEITEGYGVYFVVQDVDNDGLNEVCGMSSTVGNFSCYDTFAYAPIDYPVRTDTCHYSERRLATGVYIPKIGGKCSLSSESPSDDTEDVSISTTTLSVDIDEPDNDLVYWYIETSPDIGSDEGWGETEGTKTCTVSGLSYDTEYTWWINCSDDVNWLNTEYNFTTEESPINNAPTIQGESPTNASANIATTPTLNVTVNDEDDDTMSAKWYSNSSGTWVQFGTENSSLSDGGVIYQTNSNFSDYGTTYYWSVNLTDEEDWCNETYHFETQDDSYAGPNYYVNATSGLDTNNGSLISPWLTITHGMDLIDAGDTLYIMKGNYQEYVSAWGVTANSGTSDNWITYTNYENDDVTIDGSGDNDATDGLIWLINESYIRITGLTFANSSCNGFRADGSLGPGTHNITVDNCTFYNCSDSGIYFYPGNPAYGYIEDIIVENNTLYNCQNSWNPAHNPAPNEVITISNVTRFWVRDNYLYHNYKLNIDAKNTARDGFIYNNRVNVTIVGGNLGNGGIYVDAFDDDASNISIYNNIVWGNTTGYTMGTEQGGTLDNISFYNNIYNGSGDSDAFHVNNHTSEPGSHLKTNCGFWNNVMYNISVGIFITDVNSSFVNLTIRNNIMDNNSAGASYGIYIPDKSDKLLLQYHNVDHNLFNVSDSRYWGTDEINASPAFVDPDGGDFNITVNSPAINNGSNVDAPLLDFWGNSRIGITDIGIHEYDISCGPYSGPDYYVNTTSGDDNNYNGSLIYPFKTIWKAVNESTNGDTIHIMAGTYTPWSGHIDITSKDASSDWLTIQNYLNDVVIVDGTNCPTQYSNGINAVFQIHESNYIRITGLTINHSASGGISLGVLAGEDPVNNIRVDNCTISNSSGHAIKSKNGNNNITFEWNYLYDNFNNWTGAVKSTQETVSFENVTDFSINNNTLINNRAENIDMKGGCNGGYCCYNTINNTGTGILQKQVGGDYYGGPAIMLDARGVSHNISIFNNIIYGNASGISLNTETTGHYEYIYIYNNIINLTKPDDVTSLTYPEPLGISNTGFSGDLFHHIYIYNNVVHLGSNNNYNLIQIGHYSQDQINGTTIDEFYIYNNIFLTKYDGSSNFIGGHFLLPTDLNIGNNCYYRASGTYKNRWDETTYTNLTDWNFGEEAVYGNPQFVNSDNGNFNITATSPCINNGTDVNAPSTDFWGNSRVGTTDIGIHEYQPPSPPETYNTTIRTNGLEYFVWLGDNTTAVDCADIIDNSSGITFNSGEYISIWNKSGNYNNDWYVNGWWYEYHPYNDSGDNFDIHTYDIVKIYLTESGGDTQIDMVGNADMSYSNSRSVSLTTSTAGKNYVGWTDNAATTLKDIADTHISTTLDSGEAIYYWNETNYVWNIYIVGFYEPSIDVYEDDVIMVAVSDAETLNIGGK